jgi:hypothetical protein
LVGYSRDVRREVMNQITIRRREGVCQRREQQYWPQPGTRIEWVIEI